LALADRAGGGADPLRHGRVGSLLGELGKGVKSFKQNISDGQPGTLPPRDASMLDDHAGADPVVQRSASGTTIRNG